MSVKEFFIVYTGVILFAFFFLFWLPSTTSISAAPVHDCIITVVGKPITTITPDAGCRFLSSGANNDIAKAALALRVAANPNNISGNTYPYPVVPCNNGRIATGSYQCMMDNIIPNSMPYPEAAKNEIDWEIHNDYYIYQCIAFVETVIAAVYGQHWGSPHNAKTYIGTTQQIGTNYWTYFKKSTTPVAEGDIPVYNEAVCRGAPPDCPGHIAVVSKVIDAGRGVIEITDANFDSAEDGIVQTRNTTTNESGMDGWLRKQ